MCLNEDASWKYYPRWKKPDTNIVIFHLQDTSRIDKPRRPIRLVFARGMRGLEGNSLWTWGFFWIDENTLKSGGGEDCPVVQIH